MKHVSCYHAPIDVITELLPTRIWSIKARLPCRRRDGSVSDMNGSFPHSRGSSLEAQTEVFLPRAGSALIAMVVSCLCDQGAPGTCHQPRTFSSRIYNLAHI